MHSVGAWGPGRCVWPHRVAQGCTGLHRVAQGCTGLHRVAQGCAGLHRVAQGCTGLHRAHRDAQGCTGMHMRLPCSSSSNRLPALHRLPSQATAVGQPGCSAQAKPVANKRALPRHAWSVLLSAAGGCVIGHLSHAGRLPRVGAGVLATWGNACLRAAFWAALWPAAGTNVGRGAAAGNSGATMASAHHHWVFTMSNKYRGDCAT